MFSWLVLAVTIYLFLKLIIFVFHSSEERQIKVEKKSKPIRLAVAIPAHNEGESIAKTVQSILRAGMHSEDIYILCNGCTDNTEEEISRCGVTPVVVPCKGKEETLTYAIDELKLFPARKYSHVCFFDADTEIDQEYFKITRERLRADSSIDILCGRPKSLPCNWLTAHRAVQYWSFHAVHKTAQGKISAILVVPGCAGTYSTESLKKIVWSPDTRIGDMDATIQAIKLGMKIAFEPRVVVYTQDPSNLRDYTNQLFRRWNRGLWMNMRKHGVLWKGPFSVFNWDCRLIFLDQCIPFLYLFLVMELHLPYTIPGAIAIFVSLVFAETIICAHMEKRWDIVKYFPLFPLMRIYDTLLFLGAIPNIFVKKEKSGVWKSPKRY
jgi:cellulose synthase/poly-beta-1,6-N-acetylglucosamine synthase-like glycosyltransferase